MKWRMVEKYAISCLELTGPLMSQTELLELIIFGDCKKNVFHSFLSHISIRKENLKISSFFKLSIFSFLRFKNRYWFLFFKVVCTYYWHIFVEQGAIKIFLVYCYEAERLWLPVRLVRLPRRSPQQEPTATTSSENQKIILINVTKLTNSLFYILFF